MNLQISSVVGSDDVILKALIFITCDPQGSDVILKALICIICDTEDSDLYCM